MRTAQSSSALPRSRAKPSPVMKTRSLPRPNIVLAVRWTAKIGRPRPSSRRPINTPTFVNLPSSWVRANATFANAVWTSVPKFQRVEESRKRHRQHCARRADHAADPSFFPDVTHAFGAHGRARSSEQIHSEASAFQWCFRRHSVRRSGCGKPAASPTKNIRLFVNDAHESRILCVALITV